MLPIHKFKPLKGTTSTPDNFIGEYPPPWALKSNPLPLYIPFFQERYSFSVCYIGKWYLFHIPCLNALYFKQESTDFIKPENSSVSSFTDPNDRFPYPFMTFIILQLVKSLPFHIPEGRLQKNTPFEWSLPHRPS